MKRIYLCKYIHRYVHHDVWKLLHQNVHLTSVRPGLVGYRGLLSILHAVLRPSLVPPPSPLLSSPLPLPSPSPSVSPPTLSYYCHVFVLKLEHNYWNKPYSEPFWLHPGSPARQSGWSVKGLSVLSRVTPCLLPAPGHQLREDVPTTQAFPASFPELRSYQ